MKKRIHTIGKHGAIFFAGKHFDICAECGEPIDEGARYLYRRFKKAYDGRRKWRKDTRLAINQLNAGGVFSEGCVRMIVRFFKDLGDANRKLAGMTYVAWIFLIGFVVMCVIAI